MVGPLRVAFFGTPDFALATLRRLHGSTHDVVLVVTQPDRPRGRGQKLTPSPVKAFAVEQGIPVLQAERLRDEAFLASMTDARLDLAVVAAYGRILPKPVIDQPRLGTINVHASLLPRWRGAAPVHRAILAGDRETGVTIMRVVPALDAGPMLAVRRTAIGSTETSAELEGRLAELGAELLVETADRLAAGPIAEVAQPEAGVTYAHRLERRDSVVDWARPAVDVHNQIRGLQPWPVATVLFHGRRLLLLESDVAFESSCAVAPGCVADVTRDSIVVATRPGAVRLTRVQGEGRGPMAVRQFLAGHPVHPGDQFAPVPMGPAAS